MLSGYSFDQANTDPQQSRPHSAHEAGQNVSGTHLARDSFSLHRPSPPPGHPRNYNHMGGRVGERAGADST